MVIYLCKTIYLKMFTFVQKYGKLQQIRRKPCTTALQKINWKNWEYMT